MTLRIRLSAHVEQKISERKLDRDLVIQVAQKPDQVIERVGLPPTAQSKIQQDDGIYVLRVAYRDTNGERLVITAYMTSKVSKYWRSDS